MRAGGFAFVLTVASAIALPLHAQPGGGAAWDSVGRVVGTSGVFASGYHRYALPRLDLTLRVGDVTVAPELALGAWVGFSGEPDDAMMMGDLVLTSAELRSVLAELTRQGIEVTAIHNHLVGEEPRILYVHVHGQGRAIDLATRLDRSIVLTTTPRPVGRRRRNRSESTPPRYSRHSADRVGPAGSWPRSPWSWCPAW